jgi:hypothetical protein
MGMKQRRGMLMSRMCVRTTLQSAGGHTWFRALRDELGEIAWLLSLTAALSLISVGLAVVLALSI